MKVAVMQPYFFPYLGYFQLIHSVDHFVVLDNVNYIKRGYVNRNSILLDGQAHRITLPIKNASQNRLINQHQHLSKIEKIIKTIESSYKKAPFFNDVFPLLESYLQNEEPRLELYLTAQLQAICNYLDIDTVFTFASDLPSAFKSKGQDRIIDICTTLDASDYINSIGGVDIYDRERFKQSQLSLSFLKPNHCYYPQFSENFVNNLSVIDVLMFNNKEQIKIFLNNYELK